MISLVQIFSFLFGTIFGSFLNVLILRLPKGNDVVFKRSNCPKCQKVIHWYENIPIISFILLRGKCSDCKANISWQYPMIEIFSGIAALFLSPKSLQPELIVMFFFKFFVFSCFLVHFIIDLRHKILPDSINLVLAILFASYSIYHQKWMIMVFGILVGMGFPLLVTWIFYKLKGVVGLGGGDIKLFGALGLYLGGMGVTHNIFLSCFVGSILGGLLIVTKKLNPKNPIPFGPFILIVATFQFFFPSYYHQLMKIIF